MPPPRISHAVSEIPSGVIGTPPISGACSGLIHPHVLLCNIPNTTNTSPDAESRTLSVLLSASGLVFVVFGMLQSKTWGWIRPLQAPEIGGVPITPLGISLTAWLILGGGILLY